MHIGKAGRSISESDFFGRPCTLRSILLPEIAATSSANRYEPFNCPLCTASRIRPTPLPGLLNAKTPGTVPCDKAGVNSPIVACYKLGTDPVLAGTTRCSDSRHSFRLRSFLVAQAYHLSARSVRSCRQRTLPRQATAASPLPLLVLSVENGGPPRSLGSPCVHALLFDPGGTGQARPGLYSLSRATFRRLENVGSRKAVISGLNHTACTLAVYASQPRSHATTQDSLPAGGQPLPHGISTRRAPCAISGQHPSPTFPSAQVFLAHRDPVVRVTP